MSSSDITNKNKDILNNLKLKAQNKNLVSKKENSIIESPKKTKGTAKKLKNKQATVYMNLDEYESIEKAAQSEYLSISQYMYKECKKKRIF